MTTTETETCELCHRPGDFDLSTDPMFVPSTLRSIRSLPRGTEHVICRSCATGIASANRRYLVSTGATGIIL